MDPDTAVKTTKVSVVVALKENSGYLQSYWDAFLDFLKIYLSLKKYCIN